MSYTIKHERNHYSGYIDGIFYCSGDTYNEVQRELDALLPPDRPQDIDDDLLDVANYYYPSDEMEDRMYENGVSWSDFI